MRFIFSFWLFATLILTACGGGSNSNGGGGGGGGNPPPAIAGNRTTFIRTGDIPSSAVYDSIHNMVFAAEPDLGLVDAISIANAQIVTRIPVPGVAILGISPNSLTILASTVTQRVAWIDTTQMKLLYWQTLPQIYDPVAGQYEFWWPANCCLLPTFGDSSDLPSYTENPYILANGKVLFDTIEWDPVANTAVQRHDVSGNGAIAANPSGTEVLIAEGPEFYDSATDSVRTTTTVPTAVFAAANPVSNQFALWGADGVQFIDSQFNVLGQVSWNLTGPPQPTGMVYSADGKHLYIVTPPSGLTVLATITTIDTSSFTVVGTAAGYSSADSNYNGENPLSADATGLVIGAGLGGVVFDDSTDTYPFNQDDESTAGFVVPSEGPVQGGLVATVSTGIPTTVPDVWFGPQLATSEIGSTTGSVQATTPGVTAPSVVDVKIIEPTGVMVVVPDGFTYGSVPLLTAPLAASPKGNVIADIYGFGFSADVNGATQQVSIGGASAAVVATTFAEGIPVQDLTINVPPGSPGAANIVVTSPTGTATYPGGFQYLESVTDYSSADTFQGLIYDQSRQQLYLNAGNHIDVFSLGTNSYSAPITPPSLGGTRQLTGMALTPDNSKLIVGNFTDDSVAIVNLANPASSGAVQIGQPIGAGGGPQGPLFVATTSIGTAFIDIGETNGDSGGGGAIYELNLTTLVATQQSLPAPTQVSGEPMTQSGNGTEVLATTPDDSGGYVLAWSASTNTWQTHSLGYLFLDDVAVSGDGNVFAVNNSPLSDFTFPMFLDPNLNLFSQLGIESLFAVVNQPGTALHRSGSLFYSSTNLGVDIIDVHHGNLAERVLLAEQLSFLSGSLAVSSTGQQIFLVTNAGLTIIDLDAVPLSMGSVTPSTGSPGTVVTIRGSGFQTGTTVTFNGTAAPATFVDPDTLQITVPNIANGWATITVSDGSTNSYSLDGAFNVE
jgi:IPT/TIG domain